MGIGELRTEVGYLTCETTESSQVQNNRNIVMCSGWFPFLSLISDVYFLDFLSYAHGASVRAVQG